jgi:hypothetical protein
MKHEPSPKFWVPRYQEWLSLEEKQYRDALSPRVLSPQSSLGQWQAFVRTATLALFLFAACSLRAQAAFPEAPSATHKVDKTWLAFGAVAAADLAASAYDTHITLVGISSGHGCYEANPGLVGRYPSAGPLYAKNLGISGGLIFAGFAMKKWLHLPIAPYAAMGIDAGKHIHGGYEWHAFKGGACL